MGGEGKEKGDRSEGERVREGVGNGEELEWERVGNGKELGMGKEKSGGGEWI